MDTLIVERDWQSAYNQTTILKNSEGKVVSIITNHTKQPKKDTLTITITKLGKEKTYKLDWSKIN